MRYLLLLLFVFSLITPISAQTQVLQQDGITVTALMVKTGTVKKRDVYNFTITVTAPAEGAYYVPVKTNNPLLDVNLGRYLEIQLTNISSVFATGIKYFSGKKTGMVTSNGDAIYHVDSGPFVENFSDDVAAGATPELKASLMVGIKTLVELNVSKATDAEVYYGTSPKGRRFVIYQEDDTLLSKTDNEVHILGEQNKEVVISYNNDKFVSHSAVSDTTSGIMTFVSWEDKKMFARVKENMFEISVSNSFIQPVTLRRLRLKDPKGDKATIELEPCPGHIMVLSTKYPIAQTFPSPNGVYMLSTRADGYMMVSDRSGRNVRWMSNTPSKFTLVPWIGTNTQGVTLLNFSFSTIGTHARAAFLAVADDGKLILYRSDGIAMCIW